MANFGTVESFNVNKPKGWANYKERVEFFFTGNGIVEEARKRAIFFSICGAQLFDLAKTLCAPEDLKTKSLTSIWSALDVHFAPAPPQIAKRVLFERRNQAENETAAQYIAKLREMAESCHFGNNLDERLRDRLVGGMKDLAVQKRLLMEKVLTLDQVITMMTSAEVSDMHVHELQNGKNGQESTSVQAVSSYGRKFKEKSDRKSNYHENVKNMKCFRCNGAHNAKNCRFKLAVCHFCKKTGHIERACLSKRRNFTRESAQNQIEENESSDEEEGLFRIDHMGVSSEILPYMVEITLDNRKCSMEVDSGAVISVISEETYKKLWPDVKPKLYDVEKKYRDYQRKEIQFLGKFQPLVEFKGTKKRLPLLVAEGKRMSLLGRNWFAPLGIKMAVDTIAAVTNENQGTINAVLERYKKVFDGKLGEYVGPPMKLHPKKGAIPIKLRARNVAFSIKPKVELELQKLIKQGVLEQIEYSEWATPIVPIVKSDGSIRICGDYKTTVNRVLEHDTYPMPHINEMLSTLAGARKFAKLDLEQAYQQIKVDEETALLQTIITHKGLYKVNRLQFGINVAPQYFQKFINDILVGIEGVYPYFDDILVSAKDDTELAARLAKVLHKMEQNGLKLKKSKCIFGVDSIEYLGFRINKHGITPTEDKIEAIKNARVPTTKKELQAFLGLVNFYHMFLKDKVSAAEPLYRLLHKNVEWKWSKNCDEAFKKTKNLLSSDQILVHYDQRKQIVLTCDASPWGVGGVLSHRMDDGQLRPIAYYSVTLNAAERRYAQLDKEALAIIKSIKKFYNYLYGNSFEIQTDHKPLLGILGEEKQIPEMSSPRMMRWALYLSNFQYKLTYTPKEKLENADALSRMPSPDEKPKCEEKEKAIGEIFMLESMPETPLNGKWIGKLTINDPVLAIVQKYTQLGWPSQVGKELQPYYARKNEISTYKDVLLWGNRIIIPTKAQKEALNTLHGMHLGMQRMKTLARSHMWWPNLDKQIEQIVRECKVCREHQTAPPRTTVHSWEYESNPWTRIHIDFAGPFNGHNFFLAVDSYSKWLEVEVVSTTSTAAALRSLRKMFSTHGLPEVIVSDNATAFSSTEFENFVKKNNIRHIFTPPYHPASNGQVERYVRELKKSINKCAVGDVHTKVSRYLYSQHSTPSTVTGLSPAEILLKKKLRTNLDNLHPYLNFDMKLKQYTHTQKINANKKERKLNVGDNVAFRNPVERKGKWHNEKITGKHGQVMYETEDARGKRHRRHANQLHRNHNIEVKENVCKSNQIANNIDWSNLVLTKATDPEEVTEAEAEPVANDVSIFEDAETTLQNNSLVTSPNEAASDEVPSPPQPELSVPSLPSSRPQRIINQPPYLRDYVTSQLRGEECCGRGRAHTMRRPASRVADHQALGSRPS